MDFRNEQRMKRLLLWIWVASQSVSLMAQKQIPKWAEKAKKAVFTIEAVDKSGNVTKGTGFFISETGEAVSDYSLFIGAEKATVTDAEGKRLRVTHILGADEMYDVVRFMVSVPKKTAWLTVTNELPPVGAAAYLLPAGLSKGALLPNATVSEVSKVKDRYGYYKVEMPLSREQVSAPLLTENGEVFAMAQADASGKGKTYGISVPYIQDIRIGQMDILNKAYSSIGIRKAWSDRVEDAQVALILYSSQQDAPTYLETLNEFIAKFPNEPDGYLSRASHYVYQRKQLTDVGTEAELLERARADMEMSLKYFGDNRAEGYYNQAKLIYGVAAGDTTLKSAEWTMDKAAGLIERALTESDMPLYRQLEGDIAFFQEDYRKAAASYALVNQSPMASATSFYMAAKAEEQIEGANLGKVIALMDSACARAMTTNPTDAGAYLLETVDLKMRMGQYEAAAKDYDRYYELAGGNVNASFYYYREQAKFRAGDMDGALADIQSALAKEPENALYYAEEASIYLRKQELEKAQASLEKSISLQPDFAAGHRLLGLCLIRQHKKEEGCRAFQKAKELGDPVIDKLIKEHCF